MYLKCHIKICRSLCRLDWQHLQVVYKFIEHVILETAAENQELLEYLVPIAKRLIYVMKRAAYYNSSKDCFSNDV